ncbi:MAG: undecaprenyl-diphosphate phosphatase [Pseudomonadales bacterium]|nr:undecaprenyl-diphosphate phosphatase [Pseudomonadales bacterium]
MEPSFFQSSVLALIQGLTEFLPISSSAHLILPSQLLDWPDQGLAFDVMVHFGSLLAVVAYFYSDLVRLAAAWFQSLPQVFRGSWGALTIQDSHSGRPGDAAMAWYLLFATVPAGVAGLLWEDLLGDAARNATVIAITSIVFGILLLVADKTGSRKYQLESLNLRAALFIGLSQVLALIPGTSRSGITMSAALLLGFTREAASRFSFLMAIPIIAGSGLLEFSVLLDSGIERGQWLQLLSAMLLSAAVAYCCIHFFLRLITSIGFLPFVVYRVALGVALLGIFAV